ACFDRFPLGAPVDNFEFRKQLCPSLVEILNYHEPHLLAREFFTPRRHLTERYLVNCSSDGRVDLIGDRAILDEVAEHGDDLMSGPIEYRTESRIPTVQCEYLRCERRIPLRGIDCRQSVPETK